MLVTVSALIIAASMPALHQSTRSDSTRALRLARRAQDAFESLRRRLLPPTTFVGAGGCDALVGTYCYLDQITSAAPQEAPEVVAARGRLLATLDNVGAIIPGDHWIAGQKVRYLIEAGRPQAADSTAVACAARAAVPATTGWCLALVGYTAQQFGNYQRADAAFASALDAMTESERCDWEDLALFIGRRASGPYRRIECSARDSATASFWRFVKPLYLNSVNDLRTEFLARITRMYIEQGSRTTMGTRWRSDDRDALLRYGVALWYTQTPPPRGAVEPPAIAGFRRVPAFNFFPDAHALAAPEALIPADWNLHNVASRPTYAPVWATTFDPLIDHQVSLFRRGDSALVVAAFATAIPASRDDTRRAGVFAAVVDRGGVLEPFGTTIENAGTSVVSTLMAPWRPLIISLETLDSARHAAARARFATPLPKQGMRLSVSDLLLYSPRATAPALLSDVVPLALRALRAPSSRQVGVFWETYGVRAEGEMLDYTLTVKMVDQGMIQRALVRLGVRDPDLGVELRWREAASSKDGIAPRAVTVDLSRLKPGTYRVKLALTSSADLPIVIERDIIII